MSYVPLQADSTDKYIEFFIPDPSSSSGDGKAGLTHTDFSVYYRRGITGTVTSLSLSTLATIGTAHSDGGIKEVDATNAKGSYRLDFSDAMIAAGVDYCYVYIRYGAGSVQVPVRIKIDPAPLSATDVTDALFVTARPEPTSVPAANASMGSKIDLMFLLARNKITEDASDAKQTIYQDDGSTVFAEAAVSATGDAVTRGELTTA